MCVCGFSPSEISISESPTRLYLVVVSPLCLMFWTHLANQLLGFGSPQWIFSHDRAGITGSVDLLCWVVVRYLVGAVGTPPRRRLTVKTFAKQMRRYRDRTVQRLMMFAKATEVSDKDDVGEEERGTRSLRFQPSSRFIQVLVLNVGPKASTCLPDGSASLLTGLLSIMESWYESYRGPARTSLEPKVSIFSTSSS